MFKSAVKFLVKDSAIYGIAGAVNKLLAVFTVPIVVRVLTKEEFGITSTVIGLSTFFVGFIMLGMDSSIARWFFDNETDDIDYKKKDHFYRFFYSINIIIILSNRFLFFTGFYRWFTIGWQYRIDQLLEIVYVFNSCYSFSFVF